MEIFLFNDTILPYSLHSEEFVLPPNFQIKMDNLKTNEKSFAHVIRTEI